jgi:type III secretory pathway component EscS
MLRALALPLFVVMVLAVVAVALVVGTLVGPH